MDSVANRAEIRDIKRSGHVAQPPTQPMRLKAKLGALRLLYLAPEPARVSKNAEKAQNASKIPYFMVKGKVD
ncbi:MAG: hypothetical protein IT546_11805 [Caulobacteraceae bacterium]|nr:hypothetical protein [Caulobacteraceae bacterium]